MNIAIKPKYLVFSILIIVLLNGILDWIFRVNFLIYICDALILAGIPLVMRGKKSRKDAIPAVHIAFFTFTVVVIVGIIINQAPLLQVMWGIRNYYRFFITFYLCLSLLDKEDIKWVLNLLEKVFAFNLLLTAIQYFFLGYRGDYLGGIFGVEQGCNVGTNLYFMVLLCWLLVKYCNKEIKLSKFMFYVLGMSVNAALAELKYFFVELAMVAAWYYLVSKAKRRNIGIIITTFALIVIGINVLLAVFPKWNNFYSANSIMDQLLNSNANYSSKNDIGRSAIFTKLAPIITNWSGQKSQWLGIGLGNADYSQTFLFFVSRFFKSYSYIHYTWFSLAYLFIETGYLGTIAYVSFFISIEVVSIYRYRRFRNSHYLFSSLFGLCCMLMLFYDSALRSNYAYIVYIVLSYPFVVESKVDQQNTKLKQLIAQLAKD